MGVRRFTLNRSKGELLNVPNDGQPSTKEGDPLSPLPYGYGGL